jgi:hypothetical protein
MAVASAAPADVPLGVGEIVGTGPELIIAKWAVELHPGERLRERRQHPHGGAAEGIPAVR